jgi:hypothetical protein
LAFNQFLNFVLSIDHAIRERSASILVPRVQKKIDSLITLRIFSKNRQIPATDVNGMPFERHISLARKIRFSLARKIRSEAEAPTPATPATGGNDSKRISIT